jgi:hypothetical protein
MPSGTVIIQHLALLLSPSRISSFKRLTLKILPRLLLGREFSSYNFTRRDLAERILQVLPDDQGET